MFIEDQPEPFPRFSSTPYGMQLAQDIETLKGLIEDEIKEWDEEDDCPEEDDQGILDEQAYAEELSNQINHL